MKCNGKKITAVIMSLAMGAAFMTGCSGAGNTTAQKAGNGKSVVTVWAGGSDNVRVQFEKQIETFNASQDKYEAKLEFITSGTGAEGLFDRAVAAKKAGQTKTNFDVIELGGDEVTKYISEGGEDFFVTLDRSKIPNAENLKVESTYRNDLVIPYRGTTVVLAYNSDVVKEPPKTASYPGSGLSENQPLPVSNPQIDCPPLLKGAHHPAFPDFRVLRLCLRICHHNRDILPTCSFSHRI